MLPRPYIPTVKDYVQVFTDLAFWRPYIQAICELHNLKCEYITAGYPGTNIVFLANNRYAIKLYSPFFDGQRGYELEREIYGWLAQFPEIPMPQLLYSGTLYPDDWHYPYIITQVIRGNSLRSVLDMALAQDGYSIAAYFGRLVRRLHHLPLPDNKHHLHRDASQWQPFIAQQHHTCVANHHEWGTLPEHLINQLDAYLARGSLDLWCDPVFVHADLNADHILGTLQDGTWQTHGIIDFDDGRTGDPLYELVALHLGALHSNTALLRTFLRHYGPLPADFVWRAMALTLLHEFNVLAEVPDVANAPDLDTLAARLWGT